MKKMTKRHFFIALTIISSMVLLPVFCLKINPKKISYETAIFRTETGWGYTIKMDKKTIITQRFMQAIQGEKSFKNKIDAEKAANFVLQRIKRHQNPAVSLDDLRRLKINI